MVDGKESLLYFPLRDVGVDSFKDRDGRVVLESVVLHRKYIQFIVEPYVDVSLLLLTKLFKALEWNFSVDQNSANFT